MLITIKMIGVKTKDKRAILGIITTNTIVKIYIINRGNGRGGGYGTGNTRFKKEIIIVKNYKKNKD